LALGLCIAARPASADQPPTEEGVAKISAPQFFLYAGRNHPLR
jgi:hypothetical protein